MSRFVSVNLANLPVPDIIDVPDFQTGLSLRLEDLKARAASVGVDYSTGHLLTDPLRIGQETSMDREVKLATRINDAARAVMLADAWGSNLDHIAATYYGIARLTGEKDDDFRDRIALAPEAFSTAGPEGAYVFHALETDGRRAVSHAAAYSEEDGAHYPDGSPVLAPEVIVVVVPSLAWLADDDAWTDGSQLEDLVALSVGNHDVRPIGDKVFVMVAQRTVWSLRATLRFAPGADTQLAVSLAEQQARAYAAQQRRAGGVVERLSLGAALSVAGVASIDIEEPLADVDGGSLGCPDLETVTITASVDAGGWR